MSKTLAVIASLAALALGACGQSQQPSSSASAPVAGASTATPGATGAGGLGVTANAHSIASTDVDSAVLSGQACSLDTIDGNYDATVTVDKGKAHTFRGWLENQQQKPAGSFQIVLVGDQDFSISAGTGASRPDVASSLKNPALADAGFEVPASLDSLPSGKYAVRFLMQAEGKTYWCDAKKWVVLR